MFATRVSTQFTTAQLDVLDMVEEGDRVAVRWQLSGVKDGHPVVVPCIAIYRFVDGLVAEDWVSPPIRDNLDRKGRMLRCSARLLNSTQPRAPTLRGDKSAWSLSPRRS